MGFISFGMTALTGIFGNKNTVLRAVGICGRIVVAKALLVVGGDD